jgi:penicillin-binding protein 1A
MKKFWRFIKGIWPWYKSLYKGRPWYVKLLSGLVSCIVALIVYLGMVDINFLWLFGKSPGYFSGIRDPQTNQASEIYSADGVMIGKFFSENRMPVKFEEVNPNFWKALIDTEDERFYKHKGVDPIGLFGAVKDAILHQDARGASTLTQQLAKNIFRMRRGTQYSTGLLGKIPGLKMLIVKSKEWIIATKLGPFSIRSRFLPCMPIRLTSALTHLASRRLARLTSTAPPHRSQPNKLPCS